MSAMTAIFHKPRGATEVPDEPAVGLAGWKFAAPQIVIVLRRWPEARALSAVEGDRRLPGVERSKSAKPTPPAPHF